MRKVQAIFSISVFFLFLFIFFFGRRSNQTEPLFLFRSIELRQILIYKKEIYMLDEDNLYHFNESNSTLSESAILHNSLITFKDGLRYQCSWKNHRISAPDQIATTIYISSGGEVVDEIQSEKTIRPVTCDTRWLILTDNYPNNQGRFYTLNIETELIKEISFKNSRKEIELFESKELQFERNVTIPKKSHKYVKIYELKEGFILEDHSGGIWFAGALPER